ncbi:Response regulator of zinc sigma-54-dependent two-component system [Desulfosporosinus sp. BG]|nr:Response regulator of zinc sigma-54-dependent two-component system [Desulfosporosinus sp. BG]
MEHTGGNQSQAAKQLGLSRHAFLYRLEKYGIDPHRGM